MLGGISVKDDEGRRGGEGLRAQVLNFLEEFEGAGGEFLGGWVGGEVDSVGGAVVAGFGLGHCCVFVEGLREWRDR